MATTYNIVSVFGITLMIAFGAWLDQRTKEVQQQTELIKAQRQRDKSKNCR